VWPPSSAASPPTCSGDGLGCREQGVTARYPRSTPPACPSSPPPFPPLNLRVLLRGRAGHPAGGVDPLARYESGGIITEMARVTSLEVLLPRRLELRVWSYCYQDDSSYESGGIIAEVARVASPEVLLPGWLELRARSGRRLASPRRLRLSPVRGYAWSPEAPSTAIVKIFEFL
jgi:hypothetical protein